MKKLHEYTDYDLFIRRPADLDHRERAPHDGDIVAVGLYLDSYGRNVSNKEIRQWLEEEHARYLSELQREV